MLSTWLAVKAAPSPNEPLNAVTYFLNIVLISAIMLLVFVAILHQEITRRNAARRSVELEGISGKVVELAPDRAAVDARLVARNRSSVPLYLKSIDYSIYMDSHLLGRSSQAGGVTISPESPFILVRTLGLSLGSASSRHLDRRRLPCEVAGVLHLETGCGPVAVPFRFDAVEGVP